MGRIRRVCVGIYSSVQQRAGADRSVVAVLVEAGAAAEVVVAEVPAEVGGRTLGHLGSVGIHRLDQM